MKQETVTDIFDYLKNQGVGYLTSESCGIGIRVLCDYSERGKLLLQAFFGIDMHSFNWNPTVGVDEAVGSIMLPRDTFRPLAIFAMFMNGTEVVIDVNIREKSYSINYLHQIWDVDLQSEEYQDHLNRVRQITNGKYNIWTNSATGKYGRNVHVFSGRTT